MMMMEWAILAVCIGFAIFMVCIGLAAYRDSRWPMTEYGGSKAPSALDAWATEYANTCCIRSDGYEEDVYAPALSLLTKAYAAGQRAQAEADALIADHHAEICLPVQNETVQCAPCIAAAIRAAAPKEEE